MIYFKEANKIIFTQFTRFLNFFFVINVSIIVRRNTENMFLHNLENILDHDMTKFHFILIKCVFSEFFVFIYKLRVVVFFFFFFCKNDIGVILSLSKIF